MKKFFRIVTVLFLGLVLYQVNTEASTRLQFATPALTGKDAVITPPSEKARRDIQVEGDNDKTIQYEVGTEAFSLFARPSILKASYL